MPGAVGAGAEGKRDAACGAQISGCLSSSRCCRPRGRHAGGEEAPDNRWAHDSVTSGVCAMTPLPWLRHHEGETWAGDAVMGTAWHGWPFAGCRIPKPRHPEHCALWPRSPQGRLGGRGAGSGHLPARWLDPPGMGKDGTGRDRAQWPPPKQTQRPRHRVPMGTPPAMAVGLHPAQPLARGHPWVQAGPQDTSRHRGQLEDSPATAGLPGAEEMAKANGDLQDQAFKRLFALRISLGSCPPAPLARAPHGGFRMGRSSRLGTCRG